MNTNCKGPRSIGRKKSMDSPKEKKVPWHGNGVDQWRRRRAPAAGCGGGARGSGATPAERSERVREEVEDWGRRGNDLSAPLFMGSSGAVSEFPAHDLPNRGWDRGVPKQHMASRRAFLSATPEATRTQRFAFESGVDPGSRTRAAPH